MQHYLSRNGYTHIMTMKVPDDLCEWGEIRAYKPHRGVSGLMGDPVDVDTWEYRHLCYDDVGFQIKGKGDGHTSFWDHTYMKARGVYRTPASLHYANPGAYLRIKQAGGRPPKTRHVSALIPREHMRDDADVIRGLAEIDVWKMVRIPVGESRTIGGDTYTRVPSPDLSVEGIRNRWPNLFRFAKDVAILADGEAQTAFAGLLRSNIGSSAVDHYGGPRRVLEHAAERRFSSHARRRAYA
jgi:hypothetical protein